MNVYYLARAASEAGQRLMKRIDALNLAHPFMGSSMLHDMLNREGFEVGRRHVATLMQRMGIEDLNSDAPQINWYKCRISLHSAKKVKNLSIRALRINHLHRSILHGMNIALHPCHQTQRQIRTNKLALLHLCQQPTRGDST